MSGHYTEILKLLSSTLGVKEKLFSIKISLVGYSLQRHVMKRTTCYIEWLRVPTYYPFIKPTLAHLFTNDYRRLMIKSH